ncbi:unnamed protein product, partial [Medioppia subpectinata]
MSFQGLKFISNSLFLINNLKELLLHNNDLRSIPEGICRFKTLEKLNFSYNKIKHIPPELGRLVNLKELYLNDNFISEIPWEMGSLYNLEIFNLSNNPLVPPFNSLSKDRSVIRFCREHNINYLPPCDRSWLEVVYRPENSFETISVGTYNILCNFFASKLTYAPAWIINPDYRKDILIQNIISYNLDILYGKKDNVVLVTVLEKGLGHTIIVANTHLFWDPQYTDIKLFQSILLLEELEKIRIKHKNASILLMGDFNSLPDSSVYKLMVERKIGGLDFDKYDYAPFNDGFRHSMKFLDAYENQDLAFTNFTPHFRGVLDYIFHTEGLVRSSVISSVEEEYMERTVGLPNIHFPSDHILIGAQFQIKGIPKRMYNSMSK